MSETDMAVQGHEALLEQSPYAIPSRKFTMWLFIISDAVTFGALLMAYGYLRVGTPNWFRPFESKSVINVIVMTFVLITSSLTMLGAVDSAKLGDRGKARRFLYSTMAFGAIFALLHLREWFELFGRGITIGSGLFGQTFFTITGLHLLHVISGVIALFVVAMKFSRGRLTPSHVETTGLYWHFVDLVWMFVVPLVYLTNITR
ncbi:MAG TPA: cytochrome c oxidase subunit 3 [Candidatus Eremiobacteraceae bacterium]|nr:cytochrome c oxidase subunit 3 [Candidatus Eremiobacteraceae bacterium]